MKKLDYTRAILNAIRNPMVMKKDIAVFYILLLIRNTHASVPVINAAIVARWSKAALLEIKKLAWEEVERKENGDPAFPPS